MSIDFKEDAGIEITDTNIKQISTLAAEQLALENLLGEMEDTLKAKKKELRKIQEEDLPTAMMEAGVAEFTLSTGEKITVKPDIFPTIPKPKMLQAFTWLRENNFGSLIKNNVTIQFGKGEDERATALLTTLTEQGYNPTQKEAVHPGTLKSFVKEQVADPDAPELPEELFTVFEVRKAVIKLS